MRRSMRARPTDAEAYRLQADSKEWQILQGFIQLNRRWLEYVASKVWIRYEDYYLDFKRNVDRIQHVLKGASLTDFERPRPNLGRMYWSDAYHKRLDETVFEHLRKEFFPFIEAFWPEKIGALV